MWSRPKKSIASTGGGTRSDNHRSRRGNSSAEEGLNREKAPYPSSTKDDRGSSGCAQDPLRIEGCAKKGPFKDHGCSPPVGYGNGPFQDHRCSHPVCLDNGPFQDHGCSHPNNGPFQDHGCIHHPSCSYNGPFQDHGCSQPVSSDNGPFQDHGGVHPVCSDNGPFQDHGCVRPSCSYNGRFQDHGCSTPVCSDNGPFQDHGSQSVHSDNGPFQGHRGSPSVCSDNGPFQGHRGSPSVCSDNGPFQGHRGLQSVRSDNGPFQGHRGSPSVCSDNGPFQGHRGSQSVCSDNGPFQGHRGSQSVSPDNGPFQGHHGCTTVKSVTNTLLSSTGRANYIKLVHWNAQGAISKTSAIQTTIVQDDIDIVMIQDTRYRRRPDDLPNLRIQGYHTYHRTMDEGGHDLVTLVKHTIPSEAADQVDLGDGTETLSTRIWINNKPLLLHNLYRVDGDLLLFFLERKIYLNQQNTVQDSRKKDKRKYKETNNRKKD